MRVIDFYYFSGTGNTFMVVSEMKRVFERYGFKVNLFRMEKADPCRIKLTHNDRFGLSSSSAGNIPIRMEIYSFASKGEWNPYLHGRYARPILRWGSRISKEDPKGKGIPYGRCRGDSDANGIPN